MHHKTLAIIEKLIRICQDEAEEFERSAAAVNSSVLQALFRGYSLQRSRFAGDLETAASALGKSTPAEGATTDTTLPPRTPEKPAAARPEQAVLAECESKEEAALEAYATALEESELPPAVRSLIAAQAVNVKAAHKEIHDLSSRFVEAK